MEQGNPHHHHHHHDQIMRDAEALAAKHTLMKRLKTNAMLNSVSRVATFVAGPLFAYGLIEAAKIVGPAFAGASGGFAAGVSAATAAVAASPIALAAVGVLAIGAAFAAVAVATDYIASRKWQSNTLDSQEATAQSTGRHIAQELKKEGLCITTGSQDYDTPQRRDGKSWVQATQEQQQQQQATR